MARPSLATTTRRTGLEATVPCYLKDVTVDEHGFITDFSIAYLPAAIDAALVNAAVRDSLNLDEPARCQIYDHNDRYLLGHPGTPPDRRRASWSLSIRSSWTRLLDAIRSTTNQQERAEGESTRKISVTWDTDGEDIDLPGAVAVPVTLADEDVADWLSDLHGWCVQSWRECQDVAVTSRESEAQ